MNPKPLEFNPVRAAMQLALLGYHHVERETDRVALEEFAKNNGLRIEEGAQFTVTLVPAGKQESGTDWDKIRRERHEKRQAAAARAKKKELTQ